MKKSYIKNFQSIKTFERNLDTTYKLINSIIANVIGTEAFLNLTVKKRKMSGYDKKMVKLFSIDSKQKKQIFEMGYVTLFSKFEFFMYDFLKDLFLKFPNSLTAEIAYDDIRHFSSIDEIKAYVIDETAINKSYEIDKWVNHLKDTYGIDVFKNDADSVRLQMLNELRNAFMHSGGNTNTKFSKKISGIIKMKVPINKKIGLDRERYFNILYQFFKDMIGNFKKT